MQNRWKRACAAGAAACLVCAAGWPASAAGLTWEERMTALVGHVADALQECTLPGEAEMPQVAESPLPQGPAEEPATQAAAQSEPAPQPKIYASPQEISMIEHVVEREVHGASYSHKIAVANVIVNRVLDPRFPDNVADVLHAPGQFPVSIKNYYSPKWTPDDETINAVYAAIYQPDTTHGALYFYAPQYTKQKTASWFENKLQYCFEMEGHRFFC